MPLNQGQQTRDIIILKGNYHSEKSEVSGLFLFIFTSENKSCTKSVIMSTHDKFVLDFPLDTQWNKFEDKINEIKWGGSKGAGISGDLKSYFDNYINADSTFQFFSLLNSRNLSNIKEELVRIFYKPLDDTRLSIDVKIENVSKENYDKIQEERYSKDQVKMSEEDASDNIDYRIPVDAKLVKVDFLLSPLKGKSIYDLNVGDKIIVKLDRNHPEAESIAKSVQVELHHDDVEQVAQSSYIPLPAEVYQINVSATGEFIIVCHLKDKLFSKTIEAERVNIRIFNPATDRISGSGIGKGTNTNFQSSKKGSKTPAEKGKVDKLLFLLIALGLLTFFALIYLIYQSSIF